MQAGQANSYQLPLEYPALPACLHPMHLLFIVVCILLIIIDAYYSIYVWLHALPWWRKVMRWTIYPALMLSTMSCLLDVVEYPALPACLHPMHLLFIVVCILLIIIDAYYSIYLWLHALPWWRKVMQLTIYPPLPPFLVRFGFFLVRIGVKVVRGWLEMRVSKQS